MPSEHNVELRQLEHGVRKALERFMLIMLFVCFVLEITLGVYFYISETLDQTVLHYALLRVLLPCFMNVILYLLMFFANRTDKLTDDWKNRTCTLSFLLFCGEMSVIHSYFVPLWMLSYFALLFTGIFHDPKFHKYKSTLCILFVLISGITHIIDYPEETETSIQFIIVAEVVGFAVSYFAFQLEHFSSGEMLINLMISEGAERYKASYEFDALTGVYSRAKLEEEVSEVFDIGNNMTNVGVAMLDIDDFKKVNDTYGHDNGDAVLRKLGEYLVRLNTRSSFCGRYGGEEFVIIFKDADRDANVRELESLRKLFEATKYDFTDEHITISIGYHMDITDSEWESVLKKADSALYESKRTGKNKITIEE